MKINEIINNDLMLSDYQKEVLLLIALAATPYQALDSTIGDVNLVTARNLLVKLGFVETSHNQLRLSSDGQEALRNFNLIDDMGQPTPDGMKLLKNKEDEIEVTDQQGSYE